MCPRKRDSKGAIQLLNDLSIRDGLAILIVIHDGRLLVDHLSELRLCQLFIPSGLPQCLRELQGHAINVVVPRVLVQLLGIGWEALFGGAVLPSKEFLLRGNVLSSLPRSIHLLVFPRSVATGT